MAFATSSSAFGIKPNNPPATGSSIFGQPNAAGTSIFGASQPQANPTANNSFGGGSSFGQQNQQQQPLGSSIFGQAQQQPASGGSIFGQSAQKPATGSSIFGQSTQQQPATLFGQPAAQPATGSLFGQPAQQPATGGINLFGQSTQQPAAGAAGSLFGQSASQPATGNSIFGQSTQQTAPGTSIFGQPAQGAQSTGGSSLFGQPAPQQPQQGTSLFGGGTGNPLFGNNNTTNSNIGVFGGGGSSTMFGQKPGQLQQQSTFGAPAVQQPTGPPPFSKSTKFNDMPEELKKTFEQIDSHIQGRIQISKDLRQKKLGEDATTGQELIRTVQKDLNQTSSTIRNDLHVVRDLKAKADQAVHDTIISTRIVDGFKNPQMNGAYLKDYASFPLEYFTRVTTQIRERLVWYRATIEQIERKLSSMANQTHITPQGIATTVQAQHSTFLALASKTAALNAELQKIKTLYTQLWRARTGSVRDPFDTEMGDSGTKPDFGLSGLSVR
ncbi:hypothetical protein J3R30DRAFT_3755168 [Lentinula aciculospora]|uniref:Nucleoporin nup45 n=1 Tax=Lentinula aciculospora TaxID=153920 RepID=A0A9W9A945_9AGAR|nr:hypothetical protein J3R30DRAFT_3755168 [Lentinula aciculospora]